MARNAQRKQVSFNRGTLPHTPRQAAVVKAMQHAWKGYTQSAWGHDELHPVSQGYGEWFGLGLTLIDALDTLYLMGLDDEFKMARDWVADSLDFDKDVDINLFETTIRILGALLTTHHMTQDPVFFNQARDLADRMMPAFKTPTGVPLSDVNLHTGVAKGPDWGPDSSTSEVTTIQLEFQYLSHISGDKRYANAVNRVMKHIAKLPKTKGMVPIWINPNTGSFNGQTITFGARGDSYYEYLLKQWLLTNKTNTEMKEQYLQAMDGMTRLLVKKSHPNKLVYVGELLNGQFSPKMDHLVCFMPGMLALGSRAGLAGSKKGGKHYKDHFALAESLLETCYETYRRMETGLAPEITHYQMEPTEGQQAEHNDLYVKPQDSHNLLRPETVESLFILYRLTKNNKYREWGWEIFQNFEKHCRIESGGYSSLHSVLENPPRYRDKMESFFLGETLKYLFLLFSDDDAVVPLSDYVFNTEAHPLPVWTP